MYTRKKRWLSRVESTFFGLNHHHKSWVLKNFGATLIYPVVSQVFDFDPLAAQKGQPSDASDHLASAVVQLRAQPEAMRA